MLIHAFLYFLQNYTNLFSKSGCQISPATVTNYLLYISMLVTSDNIMFTLMLTIIVLYFVVQLQICIVSIE